MFFFASGMNVQTFLDRNQYKKNFRMTSFYLMSALILFIMGYTYNISTNSYTRPNIFQCVAMCTAFIYLMLRTSHPNLLMGIMAFLFYKIYWAWRINIVPTQSTMYEISQFERFLYAHFAFLPWVCFFLVGVINFRVKPGKWDWAFAAFYLALIGYSLTIPQVFFDTTHELLFRGQPGYMTQTMGGVGLFFLFMRRFYNGAGKSRIFQTVEMLGKESLNLLVLHFILIMILIPFFPEGNLFSTWAYALTVLALTIALIPALKAFRDRFIVEKWYVPMLTTIVILDVILFVPIIKWTSSVGLGVMWSFIGTMSFALVYPGIRGKVRKYYTISEPVRETEPAA